MFSFANKNVTATQERDALQGVHGAARIVRVRRARASVGMDGRWNVDANANRDLHDPSFDDVSMRSPW